MERGSFKLPNAELSKTPEETPDSFFVSRYGDRVVHYEGYPPATLRELLDGERMVRGDKSVDDANELQPQQRAMTHIELLEHSGHITEDEAKEHRRIWQIT